MNPVDPLAQLNPLREPVAIGWWPLAPGWWLLIAVIAVGCALVAWRLMLRYRRNAYRRQGIATLNEIRNRWQNDGDTSACLTRTNALLKAVALRAYPQRDVASVTGESWQAFLNDSGMADGKFLLPPLQAQYQAIPVSTDIESHLHTSARWINKHKVRP